MRLSSEIARRQNNQDLFRYDSDKSYSGRSNALKIQFQINSNTIIIFDDIQIIYNLKIL